MIHVGIPATPDFEFLVVFAVILAGPLVVSRFKVPGLIGMLLGGLLIGSHCFGFIGSRPSRCIFLRASLRARRTASAFSRARFSEGFS